MGADNNQIARPLKALRNFKKYEDLFYSYLKKNSQNFNNLDFYLVPKNYIRSFGIFSLTVIIPFFFSKWLVISLQNPSWL